MLDDLRFPCFIMLSLVTWLLVIRGVPFLIIEQTTGFGPFKLPTCGRLQKGRGHSQSGVQHVLPKKRHVMSRVTPSILAVLYFMSVAVATVSFVFSIVIDALIRN